ncbi:MAG: cobalamin-binding protein [Pseudomonadota bacterium]
MNKLLPGVLIFCLWLLSGCQQQDAPDAANASSQFSVIDFAGNPVEMSAPARRIIALAPHVVENVYSSGAGDSLVGVVEYSNYPPQATELPIVGGYEKTNHERIIELNPDLIIAWQSGNSHSSVKRLKELGYRIYIDQPDSLRDVAKSIRDIGTLSGTSATAERVVTEYLESLSAVEARYKDVDKISSFYQVWNKPLQTISGGHIISDAIETCGGINIYADEFAVAPIVNIESVLERNPDAIIASGMSSARPDWLDDWLEWDSLQAVQNNNLFFVDPDHIQRHTVRLLLGIESICEQLDQARLKKSAPTDN